MLVNQGQGASVSKLGGQCLNGRYAGILVGSIRRICPQVGKTWIPPTKGRALSLE